MPRCIFLIILFRYPARLLMVLIFFIGICWFWFNIPKTILLKLAISRFSQKRPCSDVRNIFLFVFFRKISKCHSLFEELSIQRGSILMWSSIFLFLWWIFICEVFTVLASNVSFKLLVAFLRNYYLLLDFFSVWHSYLVSFLRTVTLRGLPTAHFFSYFL